MFGAAVKIEGSGVLTSSTKVARRPSDGAIFEPSCPPGYTETDAYAELLSGDSGFYFLRIEPAVRRWWHLTPRWRRTGEVWTPKSGEFEVLRASEMVKENPEPIWSPASLP